MATVLVVDDSDTARTLCRIALRKNGYSVLEAKEGREALDLFRMRNPDVVLLDIEMPGMNGLGALDEMRKINPTAPVIMLTSMAQKSVVEHATRAGAVEFVVKPIQVEPLLSLVQKMLATPPSDNN
jgi:CheY-like chemotaxis protein